MLKTFVLCFVSVASVFAQTSFWSTNAVPAVKSENDRGGVNLGLRFQATTAGKVTGVRFYKGRYNTGTHVGNLWSSTGTKLASVTFTNETASGWQQANFAAPVSISADTTYVISYRAPQGGYADDQFYNWNTLLAMPLVAMGTAPGVFAYSGSVAFPAQTWNRSNYWVDVVFVPSAGTPLPPPPPPPSTYGLGGTISGTYAATIALSGAATRSTGTDSGGNYSFTGLANGAYTVTPSASGFTFAPGSTSVTINGMDMTGVNFTASVIPPPPPPPPTGQSFGPCHAVGPTATGNGSGSDWSNRMNKLPSTLARGDTYYLADGSYGSYNFNTANSGTTRIAIKKAQSYDYGRISDGCANDLSAGWNAGAMGSGQAAFSSFIGNSATPGYVTLDGNGQSAGGCAISSTDCGIKSTSDFDIGVNAGGANRANGWTLRYVEWVGTGDIANDQNGIWCHGGCDSLVIEHVNWHDSSCVFLKIPWTASADIRYSIFNKNYSTTTCHGQFYLSEVTTANMNFYGNVLQDIQGTGVWVIVTGGKASNYNAYNNVIVYPSGSTRPGTSNGIFACINSGSKCTNMKFIGNTVINGRSDYGGAFGILDENGGGSYTWQNNLFYSNQPNSVGFTLSSSTLTEDHNSWLNSGSPRNGSGDVTVASGAPNPFVNWSQGDFRLSSQNAYWGSGAVLGAPFDTDMAGKTRPGSDGVWNRGALQ